MHTAEHVSSQLQSLVTNAFYDEGFQKIEDYFQQGVHVPQKYDHRLFYHLSRAISKELDENKLRSVSWLLKCIQQFLMDDPQEESLLIQQGLISKRTVDFLTLGDLASDADPWNVLDDFFDTALVISMNSSKGRTQLLGSFLFTLGSLVTERTTSYQIQREALQTLNSILKSVPCQERRQLPLSAEWVLLMNDLARTILCVGDYDQQVALSEALCRLTTKRSRNDFVQQWFEDNAIAEAFKEIKDPEFDIDARLFLNHLNSRLGSQRRVYSFPCIAAFANGHEMRKPADEKLEKFWIDFNEGSQSITFYIANNESVLWDPVRLSKEAVTHFSIMETAATKRLTVYLKKPVNISNREVKEVEIHFDLQLGISQASVKALGQDKQMLPDQTEISSEHLTKFEKSDTSYEEKTGEAEKATEPAESGSAEGDDSPLSLSLNNVDEFELVSIGDHSPEKLEVEDAHAGVTSKRQFSDSSYLQESSVKIQIPTSNESKAQASFTGDRKPEAKVLLNYSRKRLFLEENHELRFEVGEQSWISSKERKPPKQYPGQKRTTRSSLRILPPFLPGGEGDREKDQAKLLTPPREDTYKQNNATPSKVSGRQLSSGSAVLTPEHSVQKADFQSLHPSSDLSSSESSEVEENASQTVNQESSRKHKQQSWEHSDSSDRSAVDWKKSKLDEGDAPGPIPSVTEETHLEELMPGSSNESALSTAFEYFTGELKRKFQFSPERSPLYLNTVQQAPECLKTLLNKIQQCKVDKVEQFHSSVLQELSNLEKDLQILKHFEKEIMKFLDKSDLQASRPNPVLPS